MLIYVFLVEKTAIDSVRSETNSGISMDKISSWSMRLILEKLKGQSKRESTKKMYLGVWRSFNDFLFKLDKNPDNWEDRTSLFLVHLINKGVQSGTIKTYVAAIKKTLIDDNYDWKDNKIYLNAITRGCRIINDRLKTKMPVHCRLLEMVLFEVKREFGDSQPFLKVLYLALFALGYYGLFRIGELCKSQHAAKAKDVHIGINKEKILVVLFTSKMHGRHTYPQKIKITANKLERTGSYQHSNFCQFNLKRHYLKLRGDYTSPHKQFFVCSDGSPVTPRMTRNTLKKMLHKVGVDESLYGFHSLRSG